MHREIAIGIVIAVVFMLLIVFYIILFTKLHIQKIKTYTRQLYEKDLDFQKTLTTTVIETQEQVLNDISRDLHDDAGQQLTVINFQLEHLKLDSPEWATALNPLSDSLIKLSQSIRNISHALSNQLVVQQDLLKAIAAEMKRLESNTRINISFLLSKKDNREFDVNEKIIIYRIFQECLNNSLKHSKASSITVAVKTTPKFEMTISDNGIGFVRSAKANRLSLGLFTMESRAASINYQLTITTSPGAGTVITLTEN